MRRGGHGLSFGLNSLQGQGQDARNRRHVLIEALCPWISMSSTTTAFSSAGLGASGSRATIPRIETSCHKIEAGTMLDSKVSSICAGVLHQTCSIPISSRSQTSSVRMPDTPGM